MVELNWYEKGELHRLDGPCTVTRQERIFAVGGIFMPELVGETILGKKESTDEKLFMWAVSPEKDRWLPRGALSSVRNFAMHKVLQLHVENKRSAPIFPTRTLYEMYINPNAYHQGVKTLMEQQQNFNPAWRVARKLAGGY